MTSLLRLLVRPVESTFAVLGSQNIEALYTIPFHTIGVFSFTQFCSDGAGASDAEAECEESVLQDLDPIEPDEVLDLVDAQSASESADAVRLCSVPVFLSCP